MSIEWISLLLLVSFCVLLLLGLPLAWVTGAVGTLFAITLFDINTTFMLVSRIYRMTMNYTLVAVPLFVFMAAILQRCGLAEQLFRAVYVWAGGLRGGAGHRHDHILYDHGSHRGHRGRGDRDFRYGRSSGDAGAEL